MDEIVTNTVDIVEEVLPETPPINKAALIVAGVAVVGVLGVFAYRKWKSRSTEVIAEPTPVEFVPANV